MLRGGTNLTQKQRLCPCLGCVVSKVPRGCAGVIHVRHPHASTFRVIFLWHGRAIGDALPRNWFVATRFLPGPGYPLLASWLDGEFVLGVQRPETSPRP